LVTFRSLSPGRLLPVFAGALGIGRATAGSSSSIDVRTDVVEATISASRPVPWQVDGDHLGEATTLSVRHEPDALDLVVPLASAAFG
jgi:diacylglycerol kinase family enzyme